MKRTRLLLLALLIAALCLTALAGCAEHGKNEPSPDTEQNEPAPAPAPEPSGMYQSDSAAAPDGLLSEGELKYFNEEFFNGEYLNIRNQFLSSSYDRPEQIDLFELFYGGSGQNEPITDEERAAFEAAIDFEIDVDITKISSAAANAVLTEYMGLTLDETDQVCLNYFTYLPVYDAYYNAHGDTNYRGWVDISAGERRDGLIRLYYDDTFYADGWKCVVLRETENGGYQFVSNGHCNSSDVPGA